MKAPRAKAPARSTKPPAPPTREQPQLGAFTLLELTLRSCRWPTSDGPTLYCGAVRQDEKRPYCKGHNALAYAGRGTAAEAKIAREQDAAAERAEEHA